MSNDASSQKRVKERRTFGRKGNIAAERNVCNEECQTGSDQGVSGHSHMAINIVVLFHSSSFRLNGSHCVP